MHALRQVAIPSKIEQATHNKDVTVKLLYHALDHFSAADSIRNSCPHSLPPLTTGTDEYSRGYKTVLAPPAVVASSTLRTRVTKFFVSAALSVFGWSGIKLGVMRGSTPARLGRFCLWLTFDFLLAAGLLAITAWGDTSAKLHQRTASSCYCGCAMSKTATGCAKICDLPKFASRHWAVTCTKVHTAAPAESPNAQPHLPHYSRSERASN